MLCLVCVYVCVGPCVSPCLYVCANIFVLDSVSLCFCECVFIFLLSFCLPCAAMRALAADNPGPAGGAGRGIIRVSHSRSEPKSGTRCQRSEAGPAGGRVWAVRHLGVAEDGQAEGDVGDDGPGGERRPRHGIRPAGRRGQAGRGASRRVEGWARTWEGVSVNGWAPARTYVCVRGGERDSCACARPGARAWCAELAECAVG